MLKGFVVERDFPKFCHSLGLRVVTLKNMGRPGYEARLLQVLALLLSLIRIAPVCCQHAEDYELTLLAAIRSNESGLEVRTLFPEHYGSSRTSQWPDHDLEPHMGLYFIPNHSLSSECGDQYFRCQELLVVCAQNDSRELSIIFVPLENGVLLLSYWHNSMMIERSIFIVNSSNCSPSVFYNINSKFYTVCINSYHHHAAVIILYEVQLNLSGLVTKFEGAELVELLVTSINLSSSQSLVLSNFINVDHMIIFAVGNTIIVMDILDKTRTQQLSECAQIHKLIPTIGAGNQRLLVAYCTDRYICFDPVYGDSTDIQQFSSNGVPYLCPDNSYRVTHFIDGTLQFSVRDVLINTTNNVNISSGICFKSQNRTYFAYSDQQHSNVYVYDFTTQNHHSVSPYDCSATPYKNCPQLLFLENQYLVIRDAICNLILDTTTNFSLLINISSDIADILAVLHSNAHSTSAKTSSPGTTSTLISFRSPDHTNGVIITPLITSTAEVCPGISQSESPTAIILVSSLEYISTHTSSPLSTAFATLISTLNNATVSTYADVPTSSPLSTAFATLISTLDNATVTTYTDTPTSITVHNNSVGIILTAVIGLFVIIIILVTVTIGFSIQHCWRKKR